MLKQWLKQRLANTNQKDSAGQTKTYDVDDWLVNSAEASNFDDGLIRRLSR